MERRYRTWDPISKRIVWVMREEKEIRKWSDIKKWSKISDENYSNRMQGKKRLKGQSRTNQVYRLARRDGWTCYWCDRTLDPKADPATRDNPGSNYPTIDHLVEKINGGSNRDDNCVLSCGPCNNGRSNPKGGRHNDE